MIKSKHPKNLGDVTLENGELQVAKVTNLWQELICDIVSGDAGPLPPNQDGLRDFAQHLLAEVTAAVIIIKAGSRKHHPVRILPAVRQIVGNQVTDIGSRLGGGGLHNALFQFLRQGDFMLPQRTQFQSFRNGIIKPEYPAAFGVGIENGILKLFHLGAPPAVKILFGYWKDRNTGCVYQHPDAAETVRLIFEMYLQGCGQKDIARRLNRLGRKTPAQLRAERYGEELYSSRKSKTGQFVWSYVSVKNVLVEEGYTGVLINHRTETHCGKVKRIDQDCWIRHEDFYPAIITKEEWRQTQELLKQNARPANGNRAAHRYAGLLTCGDCGNPFVPMVRYWNGNRRVEYVCKGYHGHGKEFCSSHRIHEETIEAQVMEYAELLRECWQTEQAELRRLHKLWSLRQPMIEARIAELREEIRQDEEDIDELLMLKIQRGK